MPPTLSADQVLALAPDSSAAAAGRKLGNPNSWKNLGRDVGAAWGECQGSALYQVKADLLDFTTSCNCPSRKFPCKHGIGLLLLTAAGKPAETEPPAWVTAWREKRTDAAAKKVAKAVVTEAAPSADAATPAADTAAARAKNADKRLRQVATGLENLDLWLRDLARNGLAGLELKPSNFWEQQAARLVDAKAPGMAMRIRRLENIPGSGPDWPARLLDDLGRTTLLLQAFEGLDTLDPALQADVRSLIGWTLKEDEVAAQGETVQDRWTVLGQRFEDVEDARANLRSQRSWLQGASSGRIALILQFSMANRPFNESIIPGTAFEADLAFWPSAAPQRALIRKRHDAPLSRAAPFAGPTTMEAFLEGVADALARNPWLESFPCVLKEVMPMRAASGAWSVVDQSGHALPLSRGDHWKLLALSGGMPLDLAGEWTDEVLIPISTQCEDAYHLLWEA
jgi:hypothetical protein